MTVALSPITQYFDNNGAPLSGGKLYSYKAGTLVPLATYTDRSGLTPNTNPVTLDSAGRAQIWLDENVPYKLVLQTSGGVTLETTDNFYGGTDPSQLIGVQVLTGNGTYTATPGTKRIRGKMIGGGASGGGAPATTAGQCGVGTGGGSGAYIEFVATTGFDGVPYSVGTPGVPVLGATGGAGGASTFGSFTAQGGRPGAGYGPSAPPLVGGFENTAMASGGYLNVPGRSGGVAFILNNLVGFSGYGADSEWGSGGGVNLGSADGLPARGYGAGGSGGITPANSIARYGGAGSPGFIQIEEYA